MRAKLVPMARVKDMKDVLTDASVLTEEQSALAAGIRQLGNPEFDELARTLESNAEQVEKALNCLQRRDLANTETVEVVDLIAITRVRRGERTGFTSMEDFAKEFGVDPNPTR